MSSDSIQVIIIFLKRRRPEGPNGNELFLVYHIEDKYIVDDVNIQQLIQ